MAKKNWDTEIAELRRLEESVQAGEASGLRAGVRRGPDIESGVRPWRSRCDEERLGLGGRQR
jgi:hypothetical protein